MKGRHSGCEHADHRVNMHMREALAPCLQQLLSTLPYCARCPAAAQHVAHCRQATHSTTARPPTANIKYQPSAYQRRDGEGQAHVEGADAGAMPDEVRFAPPNLAHLLQEGALPAWKRGAGEDGGVDTMRMIAQIGLKTNSCAQA